MATERIEHLIFKLHAPLASWGDIAVGEMRPSADRPTRSCVLGLVAACLGIRRESESELQALDHLRVAIRVDEPGLPMYDYHTIQVPKSEKGVWYRTRGDELHWNRRQSLETILSSRAYRMEAIAHIVVTRPESAAALCPTLRSIAEAMDRPTFAPYLGRRSCPLALPLHPRLIEAADFVSACDRALEDAAHQEWQEFEASNREPGAAVRWFWEEGCHSPVVAERSHHRHDRCTSQRNRLFSERIEHEAVLPSTI